MPVFDISKGKHNVTVSASDLRRDPMEYYDGADLAWMLVCTALVMLMAPGMGFFYSGVSGRRSALSMIWLSLMAMAVVGIQWYLWGYAIAFGKSDNPFWGGSDGLAFHKVLLRPVGNAKGPKIPELVFALFHGSFAAFTAALVSGSTKGTFRIWHFLPFIFIWSAVVYAPIAHWSWNSAGWGNKLGVLDFAGGTAVHICAAATSAMYSVFFEWRARWWAIWVQPAPGGEEGHNADHEEHSQHEGGEAPGGLEEGEESEEHEEGVEPEEHGEGEEPGEHEEPREDSLPPKHHLEIPRPHNVLNVLLGTALLWVGWMGFNGGSTLGINVRTVSALVSTNLAACSGGLSWCFLEYWNSDFEGKGMPRRPRRFSVIGFCNGIVAGLVAITPAAGYVPFHAAILFGTAATVACAAASKLGERFGDSHQIFVIHGIGGFIGMFLTGVFARADIARLDGYTDIQGGGLNGRGIQIAYQLADALAGAVYAAAATFVILLVMEIVVAVARRRPIVVRQVFDDGQIEAEEIPMEAM